MKAVFRVDSGTEIGTGHVMRCLTLAKELSSKYWDISFISREHSGNISDYIYTQNYHMDLLPVSMPATGEYATWLGVDRRADPLDVINIVIRENADLLIVDHYGVDHNWLSEVRKLRPNMKIMVIDELANRELDCDLLLDQTYGMNADEYKALVPDRCKLLLGSQYALLRDEFRKNRSGSLQRRKTNNIVRSIIISLGGVDKNNASGIILKALVSVDWEKYCGRIPKLNVIISKRSPAYEDVLNSASLFIKKYRLNIKVLSDISHMAKLMATSDLAFGAAGTTSWERCCLGLPSIILVLAHNQEKIAKNLDESGAVINLGYTEHLNEKAIKIAVDKILKKPSKLKTMSASSAKICDGKGVERCVSAIETLFNKK